jgi:hypothetical protein
MFFFIAGVQPKIVELDNNPRRCPSCGVFQARLKRTDHYISIFFLPVLRIKKGDPFVICERCGVNSPGSYDEASKAFNDNLKNRCPHCGNRIDQGFRFCPSCGKRL